jgi:hypothetical protein
VTTFLARAGTGQESCPEDVIDFLIRDHFAQRKLRAGTGRLEAFLKGRKIHGVDEEQSLDCDGYIEPIGQAYESGFRVKLKSSVPPVRKRFTLAHEACHTFFYEFVPEIKFGPHATDEEEERLCNFGASVLLIPALALKRRAKNLSPCIDRLQELASEFGVSMPAMLLRLRSVGLWQLELSIWRRLTNGSFAVDRLYGGRRAPWKWMDEREIGIAWNSRKPVFGRSFLFVETGRSARQFKPVTFEVQRRGDELVVLSGSGLIKPRTTAKSLF